MTAHDAPADTGVETLAETAVRIWYAACGWEDENLDLPELMPTGRVFAEGFLASDWLAARDAAQRADERERIAQAIEEIPTFTIYEGPATSGHRREPRLPRQVRADAARIARAGTAAGGDGR